MRPLSEEGNEGGNMPKLDELTEFERKKLAELLPNIPAEVREGALLNTPKEMREEKLIKLEEDQKEMDAYLNAIERGRQTKKETSPESNELTESDKFIFKKVFPNRPPETIKRSEFKEKLHEMSLEEILELDGEVEEFEENMKRKRELDAAKEECQRVIEERIESFGYLENWDEAKDYFLENFPEMKKFIIHRLWAYDVPDWFFTTTDELTDCDYFETCAEKQFEEYKAKINDGLTFCWIDGYDGCEYWNFPTLDVAFEKRGDVPGLVWSAKIFFVGNVKSANGEKFPFHVSISISEEDEFFTPLSLLWGLYNRKVEPEGSEIVEHDDSYTTYKIKGCDENVDLHRSFINFIRNLRSKNINKTVFDRLHKIGIIDSSTLAVINNALKRKEVKEKMPVTQLLLSDKEKKELKKINQAIEKLKGKTISYTKWGEVLKKTRSGAFKGMKRLEAKKLIEIRKDKGGRNVFVSLTDLGRSLITKR